MEYRAANKIYDNGEIEEWWDLESYGIVRMPDGSEEKRWRGPNIYMSGKDDILKYDNDKHCFFTLINGIRFK